MPKFINKKIIIVIMALLIGILLAVILWWNYRMNSPSNNSVIQQPITEKNVNMVDSWVYVTDAFKLSVTPDTPVATCAAVWTDRTAGEIGFYTIDASGEKRAINAVVTDADCIIKEDISNLNYIGITIDDVEVGGLEKPTNTGPMHLLYSLPDNPTTVYPTSGQWNYQMTASADNLNCAVTSGSVSANGLVNFTTTDYGMAGTLTADTGSVYFLRAGYANPHYTSPSYSFPTQDTDGAVSFELTVIDQEQMTGLLHLQGDVCAGDFPISMTLETPTGPPIYLPQQGGWLFQYTPLICGSLPLDLTMLIGLPFGSANLSVTGGGPIPLNLFWTGAPGTLNLSQTFETNLYSSFPNMYLGTAIDPLTHLPFTVMGTWQVSALSDAQLFGTLLVYGSNGCSGAASVNFTSY